MNRQRPSLMRIVLVDYMAFLAAIIPVLAVVASLIVGFSEIRYFWILLTSGFVFAAIAIGVLIWRINLFYAVFERGNEAAGVIKSVVFFKDRGRIDYIYNYSGQEFTGGNAVMKSKWTESLIEGQSVKVIVDSKDPKRTFIRELYM